LNLGHKSVVVTQSTLIDSTIISRDAPTTLKSTILADSFGYETCDVSFPLISKGFNLADDASCNLTAEGDQQNTEPLLRPLGYYGGPTQTFALKPSSPAIDAGVAGKTPTDQRGLPRIVDYPGVPTAVGGDNSDVGAFELQAP
jgi:hypothetical protein